MGFESSLGKGLIMPFASYMTLLVTKVHLWFKISLAKINKKENRQDMHMGVRCFKIEQQEDYKQVNIGPNCLKG